MFIIINIPLDYDTHMYAFIHIFKPTSYSSNMNRSLFYIISLPMTELLNYSFTFIAVSHYEYGVCDNECMSVCRSGRGDKGVCVEVKGDMIKYIHNVCNSGYPPHVHVTLMYVPTVNLLNIKFLSRVEVNVVLKTYLTITILSTSIWNSSKILYFYICSIWIILLFNALSSITSLLYLC